MAAAEIDIRHEIAVRPVARGAAFGVGAPAIEEVGRGIVLR